MSLSKFVLAVSLATTISPSSAASLQEERTDPRICYQPVIGQLMEVSCNNIAGIIESQGWINSVQLVATRDWKKGEQFNQINKDGQPILFIYTPPLER